jgi:hypothetical protein
MNIDNIVLFKENPSVVLKRYKDWIGRSYFNLTSQRQRATFYLQPAKALNARNERDGENPSIFYNCSQRKFGLSVGSKMNSIYGEGTENSSYSIFRLDGKTQWASKNWQVNPHKNEGIDAVAARIKGEPPKGIPKSQETNGLSYFEDLPKDDPWSTILGAKTFELSMIPKKDDEGGGFYVRWDFSPTLKELKASGDLDRACEMMLGRDYITIQPAKTTKAEPAKKNSEKKEEKQ